MRRMVLHRTPLRVLRENRKKQGMENERKIKRATDTLDRVRNLLIKWRTMETIPTFIELDEALSNLIDDRDVYKWLTGEYTSADYFGLNVYDDRNIELEQGKQWMTN